jgi:glycosyltransferase involved in cell wall biosynthesis
MSESVAVSVVMPTHNKAALIRRDLIPLLEQAGLTRAYEVIVVDNNSQDSTLHVLEQLAANYPHLRYVRETRQGAGAARNRGVLESKGELLIFVDDDIVVLPDHVARHCAYHNGTNTPICVVGYVEDKSEFDSQLLQQYARTRTSITTRGTPSRNVGLSLAAGDFSIRRDVLERVRFEQDGRVQYFDEAFYKRQDGELGYRLEMAGVAFVYTRDIYCEHWHSYRWFDMARRSYLSGYYLQRLFAKHPELRVLAPHKIVRSALLNRFLLLAAIVALGLGYVVQWVSPWLMLKGIGAWLLYHASRGYQQSMQEYPEGEAGE